MNQENELINNIYNLLSSSNTPQIKDLLLKKCEELNLSQRRLSNIIGIERKSLQRILDGEAQKIDIVTFLKLSQFLKIDMQNLMQIYVSKLTPESIKEIESTRKASFILHNFDLEILKKQNFITDVKNFQAIEQRIKSFFKLDSLFEYSQFAQAAYFSRVQRSNSDKMLNFWISLVFHQIKNLVNPNKYNRELLKAIIPKIRGLTRDEENGLKRVAICLYEAGITIFFQSYLSKTNIRGATFIYNGKPYIVLTDHNKRYDSIWFSLVHEIYHVLQDFKQIQKLTYHITGESDLFIDSLAEENANEFARELLLPSEKLKYIIDFLDVPAYVEDFAKKNNVHPAIIYGFYLFNKDKNKEYVKYQRNLLRSDHAVQNLLIEPWSKKDIEEITEQINTIYKEKK
jgi:HTH-type transcriptional regulator / antitoxin HigA